MEGLLISCAWHVLPPVSGFLREPLSRRMDEAGDDADQYPSASVVITSVPWFHRGSRDTVTT
jgi:hypothetical protein